LTTYDQQNTVNNKVNEINGYRNQAIANSGQNQVDREGIKMDATIVCKPAS